ncbi:MAG: glycosyltransferase family 2 protein [Bryobacterales bacterium]|nr:glycosyltransferase family 2 protein [Acidobacteriota bacterium]MCB9384521.1 glycosyltransferase family 2 protein [Bryobacterales bacterium]
MRAPQISIVVVSDFDDGCGSSWHDIRRVLRALADQQGIEQAEVLVAETENRLRHAPADLLADLPGARWVTLPEGDAYALKNAAVEAAQAEIVGILDADCEPAPGWIAAAIETLRADPKTVAVSGRTLYADPSLTHRGLALLGRAYVEAKPGGETKHISNNSAAFKRSAYLEHPLPTQAGIFASNLQSVPMRRAGYRLRFDPRMRVTHGFYGWSTERDIRRNLGYGVAATRLVDPSLSHSWIYRLGPIGIPLAILARSLNSCRFALRSARDFAVRWYELPVVCAMAFACCAMEAPGMLSAIRGRPIEGTVYQPPAAT